MVTQIFLILSTFVVSVGFHLLFKHKARQFGLVDVPSGRKLHDGITAVVGGAAMFASLVMALPLFGWPSLDGWILVGGLALLVACGIADDLLHLTAVSKLAVQFAAAAIMLAPMWLAAPTCPLGAWFCLMAWPLALLFVAGMINVVNMSDGVDGLAGGSAAVAFLWLAIAAVGDAPDVLRISLVCAAVIAGFLVFNLRHPWRRRATIFMGDAGSMMLGAALAWCGVKLAGIGFGTVPPVVVVWIVALPIIDGASVVIRRLRQGLDPMRADRRHLHHLLQAAGLSAAATVAVLLLAGFALGGVGVVGWYLGQTSTALAAWLGAPIALHTLLVVGLTHRQRWADAAKATPAVMVLER